MPNKKTIALLCLLGVVGCNEWSPKETKRPNEPTPRDAVTDMRDLLPMTSSDHPWRTDPALSGSFHAEYSDDLRVIAHEGGSRPTDARPGHVWVRVTGKRAGAYEGTPLNQPYQLRSLKLNDTIIFLPANAGNQPFMVTEKYLNERSDWHLKPCDKCGMPDLFDAPLDLQAKIFPDIPADAKMGAFTSFCQVCGGVQVVSA